MNKIRLSIGIVFIFLVTHTEAQQSNRILIAAASDLKFALDSVVSAFKAKNNGTIDVTYGSSGKLSEQISNGAPFDLFFSADIIYPNQLKEKGLTSSDIYPYGIGRIVIWSKKINPQTEGMKSLLQPFIKKIAIANPAHAPYGKRAEEALIYYKLMETTKDKLVYGENISQTAQFVTTGAADIGIIALSLALSPTMKHENGSYYLIPETSHQPLVQGLVLTNHAKGNDLAIAFLQFIKGSTSQEILHYFGFSKPQ
ncbi:MAG TPA: molybdate ABC transporter substrate-binding protein [Cyclobacteriaceae bacterium]|jgi:molybdate transport system substrate-binding protein|nr:molybdate ABC transporter substrate-binding protein [Cyclobacteriaceae bacterium]